MTTRRHLLTTVAAAILAVAVASPALAQGNGNRKNRNAPGQVDRERPTLQRRGDGPSRSRSDDRYDRRDDRRDERLQDRRGADRRREASWEDIIFGRDRRDQRRDVPPGWCIGRGNPHNTPENCGYSSNRRYDWDYDDRYGGYGSYSRAHTAFHRALDREYAARAGQRRNDALYQLRLRAEKAADHDRWHQRTGTRH